MVLLFSAIRTFHEIDEQRAIYLRHRVALLAARLENIPSNATPDAVFETLSQDDPYLVDVQIVRRGAGGDARDLSPLWEGRELFRTETVPSRDVTILRAYIPFHSGDGLHIARIDLNAAAADFLLVHARHNVIVASLGGLVLVLLSIYSVWAMRRAAQMRERQLEMEHLAHIGKMAAALAHEIRNPLGTIKGFVQLAGERADDSTRDLLAPVLAETLRLEALVNDLLAYGRPPHLDVGLTRWNELTAGLKAHGIQMIGDRPIRLVISDSEIEWRTDPALLTQVLLNLLRNAVDAIAGEGEVRVEARKSRGGEVSISVTDSGPGITDEAIARLFEPFFTTKAAGTGLGLAITRRALGALNGDVVLRRRPEGGTEALIRMGVSAVAKAMAN